MAPNAPSRLRSHSRWAHRAVSSLAVIALVLLLIGVGWIAERAIGSRVLGWWHGMLERIPVTRRIYSAANRIVRTMLGQDNRPFKEVVLIEYPRKGIWSVAFVTGKSSGEVQRVTAENLVNVFVPTTPNPTSGFYILVPEDDLIVLKMTVEEAFKLIISGGMVTPPERKTPVLVKKADVIE